MTEQEMINGNKLIAEFMGYKYETGVSLGGSWSRFFKIGGVFEDSFPYAKYNELWDWIIPVVEYIENLPLKNAHYAISITNKICSIYNMKKIRPYLVARGESDTKIEATYKAIIEFINYYNQTIK